MFVNCPPFVRQYDILDNKWGAVHSGDMGSFLCLAGHGRYRKQREHQSWEFTQEIMDCPSAFRMRLAYRYLPMDLQVSLEAKGMEIAENAY